MNIGFIGLGHMGLPMAKNLLKAGFDVIAYDRISTATENFQAAGGQIATSDYSNMIPTIDAIITMLPTGNDVRSLCLGSDGLFAQAKTNTLFIDCSSIDVATTRELQATAKQQQHQMIDAPVSGGVAGATAGTLTFMIGGEQVAVERAEPILSVMGKKLVHTGIGGTGQAAKICNNHILGISMIAVSEAFLLAEKLGLSAEKLFEVSSQSSGQCWSLTQYCPMPGLVPASPANRDYQAGFSAKMMLKDLRLSQASAAQQGIATPLGAEATTLYSLFCQHGHGDVDFSGIIKFLQG